MAKVHILVQRMLGKQGAGIVCLSEGGRGMWWKVGMVVERRSRAANEMCILLIAETNHFGSCSLVMLALIMLNGYQLLLLSPWK